MTDHDRVWLAALAIVGLAWLINTAIRWVAAIWRDIRAARNSGSTGSDESGGGAT